MIGDGVKLFLVRVTDGEQLGRKLVYYCGNE